MSYRYSYSRRITLDTCLRQYFYQYYAADKDCPLRDELKADVRRLKALSNCDMLAGKILEQQIRLHLRRGAEWSPAWFLQRALNDFDRIVEQNRSGDTASLRSDNALLEFFGPDSAAQDATGRARGKLSLALHHYFDAPELVRLRASIAGAGVTVGKKISGLRVGRWIITGEIDLLVFDAANSRIIDWKIGISHGPQDSLQLFIYSWFASEDAALRGTTITAQRAFLGNGTLEPPTLLTTEHIHRGRARVLQDIELMDELDQYGREGVEEVFTPCMKENVCRRCKFQSICPKITAAPNWKQTYESLPLFQAMS
ncbi:MAG: PD-(D/E)XK nuclease family protein [Phycisphaerae bacterium]|nr:PD-(D/E)XK nuclease family protein [Phycisphaerae bacterium]